MKLEELKNKIDQLLSLNDELRSLVIDVTHDSAKNRNYLQGDVVGLVRASKKYNLKLVQKPSRHVEYPLDISIPELKVYAITTADKLEYLKRMIQEEEE